MIEYRRDIDGLRGLAVISVILSHTGLNFFKSGFLGVDIFFVISGYLISAIIFSQISLNKFSLAQFYMRRIRRIFPALFFIVLCSIPFAYYWMMPIQLYKFGHSLLATVFFLSNIMFFFEHGYFDAASAFKPFLHTWSLGVEEQFYVIYPVFILLLCRFVRKSISAILLVLITLSLATSFAFEILLSEKFAFFLTPARVWEFFCGAVVFRISIAKPLTNKRCLSGLGATLISLGFILAGLQIGLASVYTALTVIGASLLIGFPAPKSRLSQLLSSNALIGLGLISYSAYLWHQPIFAFARIRSFSPLSTPVICGLLCLVLALSYISWRYIEQPFRAKTDGTYVISTPRVFMLTALCLGLILSFSIATVKTIGLPDRMPTQLIQMLKTEHANVNRPACHHESKKILETPIEMLDCLPKSPKGQYDFFIIGDSHADSLAGEILTRAQAHGLYGNQITVSACSPFLGYNYRTLPCHAANEKVLSYIKTKRARTVIISARYSKMLGLGPFSNGEGGVEFTEPVKHEFLGDVSGNDVVDFTQRVHAGIDEILKEFDHVILVYPIPEAGWHVPQRTAKQALFKKTYADISTSYEHFSGRNKDVLLTLDGINNPRVIKIRPSERLCSNKVRCMNVINQEILYNDAHHLSAKGAAIVAPDIVDALLSP